MQSFPGFGLAFQHYVFLLTVLSPGCEDCGQLSISPYYRCCPFCPTDGYNPGVCVPCFWSASADTVSASHHQRWSCKMSTQSSMRFCREFPPSFKFPHSMHHCLTQIFQVGLVLQLPYRLQHYIHYLVVVLLLPLPPPPSPLHP